MGIETINSIDYWFVILEEEPLELIRIQNTGKTRVSP